MTKEPSGLMPIEAGLRDILVAEHQECESSFLLLAKRIAEANGNREGYKIDRRKLADAVKKGKIDFTVREIVALENYLRRQHRTRSVGRLFEQARLPQALTGRGNVVFLLGTRSFPNVGTIHLSWWDMHAMAEVLRVLQSASPNLAFTCEDVLVHSRDEIPSGTPPEVYFSQKNWYKLLEDREDNPSLVCVGSPRACHAAEIMLARMLGRPAFIPVNPDKPDVPFFFFWDFEARSDKQLPSCVMADSVVREGQAGLWIGGKYHVIDENKNPSQAHGLLVAQRRPKGQVWVLVMGTSGPLTTAAAREMAGALVHLPGEPNEASKTWWQAIWGSYTGKAPRPPRGTGTVSTDKRELVDHHTFGEPHLWQP